MKLKYFFIILILITFNTTVKADSLLLNNANINYEQSPYRYQNSCNWLQSPCLVTIGNARKNGEIVNISNDWNTISSVSIPMRKSIISESFLNPTITIRVYKSTTNNPGTSVLTLWDSTTTSITNTNIANINFVFDSPLLIYESDVKVINYIFIELQETYGFGDSNEIHYGYYQSDSTDIYLDGKNYQYSDSVWSSIESWLNPLSYNDMAFKVYGTYRFPPSPLPTPDSTYTSPDTNSSLPCVDCDSSIPGIDSGNENYNNTAPSINFSNPRVICPECFGNETTSSSGGIPSGSGFSQMLKNFGYCNSAGCVLEDIISFLYDFSKVFFVISMIIIIYMNLKWNGVLE